ncbi:S-layer protein domain-containing protein, partial [Methanolobus halotolerans]
GSYPVLGLFAEKYVALDDNSPDELVKLLLDSDDKYTLRTGSALELPNGYEVVAKQIDVDGNKVWMEFSKDGEFIDDEVLNVANNADATWTFEADVGDTEDVIVFRVMVTQVFQGQVDSLAIVEGLYLVDHEDVLQIETGDEFGELEIDSISGGTIEMSSTGALTLRKDDTIDIGQGMMINVADSDDIRFYIMKEYTEPGTYEIRGSVATGAQTWTPSNFAGFFYDIDDNIGSEELAVTSLNGRTIAESNLTYSTTIEQVDYAADFEAEAGTSNTGSYPVLGLFAEKYVALDDNSPDELVKLLLDSDDKYTLRTGSALELPNGYEVVAKQIDVDGNKVWMEFSKDGEFIDDEVLNVANNADATWTFEADVGDTEDVIVFRVLVTQVFQGQVDSLAIIEGLYLVEHEDVLQIETGDEFGELEIDSISGGTIEMSSTGSITLSRDDTVDIAEGMMFRVADSPDNELRYYPFVEWTIEGDGVTQPDDEEPVEEPVDETPAGNETGNETPVDETPVDETPVDDEEPVTEEPAEESPGFEAIFAVAGLLAVAYLVRRN